MASTRWLIFGIALLSGVAGAAPGDSDQLPVGPDVWADQLARALAVPPERLSGIQYGEEILADGRRLTSIKAVDLNDGDIVGRSFIGPEVVDAERVRHEANTLWRFAHGAKTQAMVERLQELPRHGRLVVDLWYAFEAPDDGGGPSGSVEQAGLTGDGGGLAADRYAIEMDGKTENLPLPPELAAGIEGQLSLPSAGVPVAGPEPGEKVGQPDVNPAVRADNKARAIAALAEVESHNQQRIEGLRMALAPVRASMVQRLVDAGWTIIHASDLVPSIVMEGTRRQLEIAARWPDVAWIDPEGRNAGPSLDVARAAHNVVPLTQVGYDGSGVTVAVVEGARVYSQNPFLPVSQTRDTGVAEDDHSMAVAGVIRSSHDTQRGMAPAATLISGDGQYNVAGVLETATDWAAARAQVLNHSWGFKEQDNSTFAAFDRRLDHIGRYAFRLNVHAAGNNGATNCGQSAGNINTVYGVESPGRGYNTLTVGGFDDGGTIGWGNDVRYRCSATGSPTGDSTGGSHLKPEIAAAAVAVTSLARTTSVTSPLSGAWTGTSFAAPAMSGIAANLMEADAQLAGSPVATRALLMVGAIHNPAETPAVSATASTFATEVGPWWFLGVDGASFPRSYNVYARAGQRVRFAINWLSNVTLNSGTYSDDRLPADLDLRAYRSNGTLVTSSISSSNAFEIVDFYAPVADTYEFRVTRFNAWTGGATPFAAAARLDGHLMPRGTWWTGSAPAPQGRFYDIRPAEEYAGNTIYWRGVALRPTTADYDLELFDTSWFLGPETTTDTFNRRRLALSNYSSNGVDFIMVDGNHWPNSKREHYRVSRWNGSGAFSINAANFISIGTDSGGLYGPYTMDANTSLFVVDLNFSAHSLRRIKLLPAGGGGDLALAMFRSDPGNSETWARTRSQAVAQADAAGVGGVEILRHRYDGAASDWLGLAVYNKTAGTTPQFYLRIEPSSLFSDGFNGD